MISISTFFNKKIYILFFIVIMHNKPVENLYYPFYYGIKISIDSHASGTK